jgi:hypothetical protein
MKNSFKMLAMIVTVLAGTAGIAAAQDGDGHYNDGRYSDRDDYRYDNRSYDNNDYRYQNRYDNRYDRRDNVRQSIPEAREFGFRDGSGVAREDMSRGKPFNPNPRGRFDDADHGYRSEFGNKHEYREHYTDAYREGYQRNYSRRDYRESGRYYR